MPGTFEPLRGPRTGGHVPAAPTHTPNLEATTEHAAETQRLVARPREPLSTKDRPARRPSPRGVPSGFLTDSRGDRDKFALGGQTRTVSRDPTTWAETARADKGPPGPGRSDAARPPTSCGPTSCGRAPRPPAA